MKKQELEYIKSDLEFIEQEAKKLQQMIEIVYDKSTDNSKLDETFSDIEYSLDSLGSSINSLDDAHFSVSYLLEKYDELFLDV